MALDTRTHGESVRSILGLHTFELDVSGERKTAVVFYYCTGRSEAT